MYTAAVVGQIDSQNQRQHQESQETQQQHPGPGDPNPVAAAERAAAIALLQRFVASTRPGHDCHTAVLRLSWDDV